MKTPFTFWRNCLLCEWYFLVAFFILLTVILLLQGVSSSVYQKHRCEAKTGWAPDYDCSSKGIKFQIFQLDVLNRAQKVGLF